MEFPVLVIAEVLTDGLEEYDGVPISFFRELSLPFAPTVGLALHQKGWLCGPLEKVEWHETLGGFICRVPPDDTLIRGRNRFSPSEYCEFYEELGWKRLKKGESWPEMLREE